MTSATRFSLVVVEGPSPGQQFDLSGSIILGREAASAGGVAIDASTLSRRHARITLEGDRCWIADLNSTNGTFLNGRRLSGKPEPLQPGDRIQLGPTVVLLLQGASPAAEAVAQPRKAPVPATIMGDDLVSARPTTPPQLLIDVPGEASRTLTLTEPAYTLGRSTDNDIVLSSGVVSRHQARLERTPWGYNLLPVDEASNPVLLHGEAIVSPRALHHCDALRIGAFDPAAMVSLTFLSLDEATQAAKIQSVRFGEGNRLQIGRDPANDIVLDAPTVSRFHATIERIGQRFRVRDLRSSNATFLNDQRIEAEAWAKPGDTVRVGSYRFVIAQEAISQFDESGGLHVDAIGLNKRVRKNLNILQNISLTFKPREFIVIVGQSGGGKSTLLDAIAGYRPATDGRVFVNDIDAYRSFDAIRNSIGYVPQRDIIHMELTVYQALDYAARLRMPADTSPEERHLRVMQVLDDLDLTHRKEVQVSGLSGGQQKRVSIGVELLTKPGLFFLDEPTSGLDPGTETALMQLMRRLADQGRTIILVTHATKNVMLADKVVFLARGGHVAWFGPPEEALRYFDRYRSDRERRAGPMDFDQIYAILDNSTLGSAEEWSARFRSDPAHQQYIEQPLAPRLEGLAAPSKPMSAPRPPGGRQTSAWRQFLILSSRNLKILTRDRASLLLMLLAPPLVSMLDVLIAFMMGRRMFDFYDGDIRNLTISFFLLIIFAMFVGGLSQMREIVKEIDIYKRERLVNLKIGPYVLSKVWLAALLAVYQAAAYTIIHYLAYEMPGGALEFLMIFASLALLSMAGMMLGLLTSALAPNANTAPMIVILFIMPQVVLSGALVPLPGAVSAPGATRWAFEALMGITGAGSDVAADPCWQLPDDVRETMSLDDRTARCPCMGLNVLNPASCSVPGIGTFYDPAVDQPEPAAPPPLRDPPAEPVIPPAPAMPADQSDKLAMAEYFGALERYQDDVARIQDLYKAHMKAYQAEADLYEVQAKAYQEERTTWMMTRTGSIEAAEGVLDIFNQDFGWTFIDKSDRSTFLARVGMTWVAQVIIILVLLAGVFVAVKRKDVI